MAARPVWSGYIKLSLVTVPVKAYSASGSEGEVHLNQLHADCGARIQYKKTCPIHGEVANDQIVAGHEYAKGQYVMIDPEELDKLRTPADKMVNIGAFVAADAIDPLYLSGQVYYLVPEGPVAHHPFRLIREGMIVENRHAVAKVVVRQKEQLVLLRPAGNVLAMFVLDYDFQVKKPAEFADMLCKTDVESEELDAVKALIEARSVPTIDLAQYKDTSTERLKQLVEAKVAGKEIVAPPAVEHVHVINLMGALKASVAEAKAEKPAESRPPKKVAPSSGQAPAKKRKSS